jgi:hypothetical protein
MPRARTNRLLYVHLESVRAEECGCVECQQVINLKFRVSQRVNYSQQKKTKLVRVKSRETKSKYRQEMLPANNGPGCNNLRMYPQKRLFLQEPDGATSRRRHSSFCNSFFDQVQHGDACLPPQEAYEWSKKFRNCVKSVAAAARAGLSRLQH